MHIFEGSRTSGFAQYKCVYRELGSYGRTDAGIWPAFRFEALPCWVAASTFNLPRERKVESVTALRSGHKLEFTQAESELALLFRS